jgi:exopolysaccharide production protein ExoZ
MRREPIYGLDIVRFLAASTVLFYHLGFKAFGHAENALNIRLNTTAALPPWAGLTWWGWIGVQVFFVISGLVIAYSAEGANGRTFLRSRVGRLVPAMVIASSFIALVVLTWDAVPLGRVTMLWLKSVTFFPIGPWLAGQFWTLPIEIAFYGIVWLMILGRSVGRLEVLAWVLAVISAIYWAVLSLGGVSDPFGRLTQLLMLQHGCYFALGILLQRVDQRGWTVGRGVLASLCVATAWVQIQAAARGEELGYGLEAASFVPFAAWLAAIVLIGASMRWKQVIAGWVAPHRAALRTMGLATYPLYLIHMHVGGPMLVILVGLGVPPALALIVAFAACVAAALVIALWLEPALRGLIDAPLKKLAPG